MRVVVWAGVSSRPQAELDSLDQQIADGRAWAERQGAGVAAVLVVPGVTRNFIDFYDALAGLDEFLRPGEHNAYRELERLLAERAFDVLWIRGRDRLGRTDALIAGVEERCRRAGVVVQSQAMPATGHVAGDLYTAAIERASAQREIVELVRRNRYGMDGRLARGLPLSGPVPFGYQPAQEIVAGRLARVAVAVPEELESYRWLVAVTLDGSVSLKSAAERLAGRWPERQWARSGIRTMLASPFYAGLVLRRRERHENETAALRVVGPETGPLVDPLWPDVETLLAQRVARGSALLRDQRGRPKIALVSVGRHEPAIDLAQWLELQRLLDLRSETRHPVPASALWAGILRCGLCGARMAVNPSGQRPDGRLPYTNYVCGRRRDQGPDACRNRQISERRITKRIVVYLRELFLARGGALANPPSTDPRQQEMVEMLASELAGIHERRDRLTLLFETGRIDLDAFDRRAAELRAQAAGVEAQLAGARQSLADDAQRSRRTALLADILPALEERLGQVNQREANRWLRQIFRAVYVVDGEVTRIEL